MAKKEKTPNKKSNLSSYWLYGLIAVFFISMSYFNNGGVSSDQRINISTFERFLNDDEVERVLVINKSLAQVTIKNDALQTSKHKKARSTDFLGRSNSGGPHYEFEVGNLEIFQTKLEEAKSNGIAFDYDFKTVENRWLDVMLSFLPLILIIGVWIFLMRRMSGGGAGGVCCGYRPSPAGGHIAAHHILWKFVCGMFLARRSARALLVQGQCRSRARVNGRGSCNATGMACLGI